MAAGLIVLSDDEVTRLRDRRGATSFLTKVMAHRASLRTASPFAKEIELSDKFENMGAQLQVNLTTPKG